MEKIICIKDTDDIKFGDTFIPKKTLCGLGFIVVKNGEDKFYQKDIFILEDKFIEYNLERLT